MRSDPIFGRAKRGKAVEGILGKKLGMTQIFTDDGSVIPVTVIEAGPCVVVAKRAQDRDAYTSVQLGFLAQKAQRVNKPMLGHFQKRGLPPYRVLREFRGSPQEVEGLEEGQGVTVSIFQPGEKVKVTGKSKGKGFQGVMKRHGFGGSRDSHGARYHRAPGSIGQCTFPARVFKGLKMPGQMGNRKVTVRGLEVVEVLPEKNLLLVKGSVPGPRQGLLIIRKEGR